MPRGNSSRQFDRQRLDKFLKLPIDAAAASAARSSWDSGADQRLDE